MSDQLQMTDGMHIIVEALKQNNIDTIYGVVGIPVTDMARHAQAEGIRYIGFRHEQSAGYAAAASGFLTQKPGICLTVSAPGFLNGLTALANATVNGFPMIMISGSSDRAIVDLQQGDYEELDQMNAAKPYAKAAFRVNQPQDLGIALARAIRVSVSGRPGGVYLDLPANVLAATMEKDEALTTIVKVENPSPALLPCPKSVASAISLLAKAERPLVILGKGAAYSQADEQLREFIESAQIPFLPMSMAKGILEDTHPLSAAAARSFALANADVVMLVGARLNWLLAHGKKGWAADTQFIQLDIEPQEIDSNRPIAVPVVGDIASSMQGMLAELKQNTFTTPLVWRDILNIHKQQNAQKIHEKLSTDTQPLNYFNALSGTWGVMGIGMGYAIGASVTSGSPVVAIEGDSAFGFSGMEIETICRYNLPVTIVIFNNGGIYRGDGVDLSGAGAPSPTDLLHHARYDKLMDAFRGVGYNVTTTDELRHALTTGIQSRKPTIINVVIDPAAGTESGHITKLNPKQVAGN